MTAFSLVWPSPATVWKSLSFRPVFFRNSGQICVMEFGRRDRHRLALDVLGLLDVLFDKAHRRHRAGLQQHAGGDDRRALHGRAHHGGHVDIAEIGGLGRNGLRGRRRAAAFLDFEVDALGGIDALGLAVIERRVLAIDVPVEHQHDLVGGRCRKHRKRGPDQGGGDRRYRSYHGHPPVGVGCGPWAGRLFGLPLTKQK